ncbi:IclR family transcriptional regulator C-terminal domain-containing protein [Dongia sp.]|uniref:IclR family transcriptional regulator domain-containing protein n=1 Tax=Dongia sp. TaxID=1977262 RepID=UPI0035ADAF70
MRKSGLKKAAPEKAAKRKKPAARSERVNSLARGLEVLLAFGRQGEPMTITDMALATGMPAAAARRMLLTLTDLGYVEQRGKRFQIGVRVLDLGYAYLASMPLWQIVQPVTERISQQFDVASSAAVLDGTDIVLVVRANNRQPSSVLVSTGTRQPAHVTAMGRVLLAHQEPAMLERILDRVAFTAFTPQSVKDRRQLEKILAEVRRQDYAIVDEEMEFGLRAIAVPLRNRRGEVVAALNAAGHKKLLDLKTLEAEILPAMIEAARQISAHIGS